MAYYDKNIDYIDDVYVRYNKNDEFQKFEKDFRNFSNGAIVRMYTLKKSNEIKQFISDENITQKQKIEKLESLFDFFKNVGLIDNMIRDQNKYTLEKTRYSLGTSEDENPFIINRNILEKEFNEKYNSNLNDEILDLKIAYWENRYIKYLESIRRADINKIYKFLNPLHKKVTKSLHKIQNRVTEEIPMYASLYEKYLNKEITKEEFEKTEEFKCIENIKKEVMEKKKIRYNEYELFDLICLQNNISKGYIEKNKSLENVLVKGKEMDIIVFEDKALTADFKVLEFKPKNIIFNTNIDLHIKGEELAKIEEKIDEKDKIKHDKEEKIQESKIDLILVELTDNKIKSIKEKINNIEKYDRETRHYITAYAKTLNIEIPEYDKTIKYHKNMNLSKRNKMLERNRQRYSDDREDR